MEPKFHKGRLHKMIPTCLIAAVIGCAVFAALILPFVRWGF